MELVNIGQELVILFFDVKGIPKVDIIDEIGICQHPHSTFCDIERKKHLNCQRHSKWMELF